MSTPPGASCGGRSARGRREKRFVRPDGSVVWAIANLTFLRDEDGNPVSWVGQFQDITDRHGLETRYGASYPEDRVKGSAGSRT